MANAVFGEGFYQVGRFGQLNPNSASFTHFISPTQVSFDAGADATLKALGWGDTARAARHCCDTLSKYRYTVGYKDIDKFYERCRFLMETEPEAFQAEHRRELSMDYADPESVIDWFIELYQSHNQDWALKVLIDFCQLHCSFNHPITYPLLIELLGDSPTGRWVQQRKIAAPELQRADYNAWEKKLINLQQSV